MGTYLDKSAAQRQPDPKLYALRVYSSGTAAMACGVARRTVANWFDSGRLKGYRMPASGTRRIPRDELIRFLKEHRMPQAAHFEGGPAVLYGLPAHEDAPGAVRCETPMDLAAYLAVSRAAAVVVGDESGVKEALSVVRYALSAQPQARVLLVLSEDAQVETGEVPDGVRLVRRPADWRTVLAAPGASL